VFGILSKKDEDVYGLAASMYDALSFKTDDGWVVTDGTRAIRRSNTKPPVGKVCLAGVKEPIQGGLVLQYDGMLFNEGDLDAKEASPEDVLKRALERLDGEYSVASTDGEVIAAARDRAGRRPVFYGENDDVAAFSSEKKALWAVGIRDVKRLRAGTAAVLSKDGVEVSEGAGIERREPTIKDFDAAVEEYRKVLYPAFEKRLRNVKRVGALLSGGVDSTLSTKLTLEMSRKLGFDVRVYSAGTESAPDLQYATRFTQALGVEHRVRKLALSEVGSYMQRVVRAVEERDFIQVEAGIGVYAAEEAAARDGVQIVVSGQGPDELWGGYEWYPRVIAEEGYEGFLERCWGDLERADIETFDRENRIAASFGMEVVFPYADTEVIKLAMSVSPELKINSPEDRVGKRPHRELAKRVGVPSEFGDRKKDAAQHGTGIHDLLDQLARDNGFTPDLVKEIGYKSEKISGEKLGSSARYGYRYSENAIWEIDEHIQLFIDSVAQKEGLLNEPERTTIGDYLKKARLI